MSQTALIYDKSFVLAKLKEVNLFLEKNNLEPWYFGYDKKTEKFYLSVFDEHNPQEELVFIVSLSPFEIVNGVRYKRIKQNAIREDHSKYIEAQAVIKLIAQFLKK